MANTFFISIIKGYKFKVLLVIYYTVFSHIKIRIEFEWFLRNPILLFTLLVFSHIKKESLRNDQQYAIAVEK